MKAASPTWPSGPEWDRAGPISRIEPGRAGPAGPGRLSTPEYVQAELVFNEKFKLQPIS